jgi:hypothetical protein
MLPVRAPGNHVTLHAPRAAGASGYLGPGDCVGPPLSLQAEITVTVVP